MDNSGSGKFQASIIAGAITTVIVWALNTYSLKSNPIPPEIAAAIATIVNAACVYFTPHDASVANLIPGKGSQS